MGKKIISLRKSPFSGYSGSASRKVPIVQISRVSRILGILKRYLFIAVVFLFFLQAGAQFSGMTSSYVSFLIVSVLYGGSVYLALNAMHFLVLVLQTCTVRLTGCQPASVMSFIAAIIGFAVVFPLTYFSAVITVL